MSRRARAACPLVSLTHPSLSTSSLYEKPEILIVRQATRHDCLPSLLGDGDKKIMYGEEKIFFLGLTGQDRTGQKSLVPIRQA
jgi:hypothetical protein